MFKWIRKCYDQVLALSERPRAVWWLAAISFAESSFFPIPPDVLLLPVCLAHRRASFRIAAVCTIASALGGLFGYALGFYFFDSIGEAIISAYGAMDQYEAFKGLYDEHGSVVVFAAGFSPIPYKVITITAGVFQFPLLPFLVLSVISRGLRFFLLAGLVKWLGEVAIAFVDQHFEKLTIVGTLLLIGGFVAFKLV